MHRLTREIDLPITLEQAWDFFSSPKNLKTITPPYMGFEIRSDLSERMYPGQIITYTVRPLLGIGMTWVTEIKHVEEGRMFVDEQRFGPYALWHHKHFFEEIDGGIHMTDIVDYKLPVGFFGRWLEPVLVRPKLKEIFDYRTSKLNELFGTMESPGPLVVNI
ncbi:MAG: SRPBCC family protein [Flavobacteriales bacterium]|nr:SRPBCC family protein [Flavobacteriales bacterium]